MLFRKKYRKNKFEFLYSKFVLIIIFLYIKRLMFSDDNSFIDYQSEKNIHHVAGIISNLLENQLSYGDVVPYHRENIFEKLVMPEITLEKYIFRILRRGKPSEAVIIASIIYFDMALKNYPDQVNIRSIHRIYLVAILLASKYIEDDYYMNDDMAKYGGISLDEINRLEKKFCDWLDFDFIIFPNTFNQFRKLFVGMVT
jgi:hypothetical protein